MVKAFEMYQTQDTTPIFSFKKNTSLLFSKSGVLHKNKTEHSRTPRIVLVFVLYH